MVEPVRTVKLQRSQPNTSFGFTIVEHTGVLGMRIGTVTPGGVADMTKLIFPGDVVLKVSTASSYPNFIQS